MSARQVNPYGSIARKWLALAERRRAHLVDILESGRWLGYVTGGELQNQLYDLDLICERFAEIAAAAPATAPTAGGEAAVRSAARRRQRAFAARLI
jgi:hypothetical protein